MTILNKLKWTAALSVVFLLILATNLIDQDHFRKVRQSIVTIHEDRLVVTDYIYQLAMILSDKRLAIALNDTAYFSANKLADNDKMIGLINNFYDTKLTSEERKVLGSLEKNLNTLVEDEADFVVVVNNNEAKSLEIKSSIIDQIAVLKGNLNTLANIQMKEGRRQIAIANRSVDSIDLFTRIEIIALIIIGILFQIIILYKPKVKREHAPLEL